MNKGCKKGLLSIQATYDSGILGGTDQLLFRCQSNSHPAGVKFGSGEGDCQKKIKEGLYIEKKTKKVHFTAVLNCNHVGNREEISVCISLSMLFF